MDLQTAELVQRLRTGADAAVLAAPRPVAPVVPVVDVEYAYVGVDAALVLDHLDDRDARRRHRPGAAPRDVRARRRRDRHPVARPQRRGARRFDERLKRAWTRRLAGTLGGRVDAGGGRRHPPTTRPPADGAERAGSKSSRTGVGSVVVGSGRIPQLFGVAATH